MSLTEQIITQLKTDMDNVYDAGYQKGKSEGGGGEGLDVSKFGIINEVTGTNIATCDYVNENPHNVEVKLSSDTITDFSGTQVKVIGKNWWSLENEYSGNGIIGLYEIMIPKGDCIMSYDVPVGYGNYDQFSFRNKDGVEIKQLSNATKEFGNQCLINLKEDVHYVRIVSTAQMTFTNFQIEKGKYTTDYEPYTEKTYTPNADGTVDVASISPTMNIICDTEGVNVSAKYYCSPTAEYDRFWDNYQDYGNRTDCKYMFYGSGWNNNNLKPKYEMKVKVIHYCFCYCMATDLTEVLSKFDTYECTDFGLLCQNSSVKILPKFSVKSAPNLNMIFYYAINVREIECIEDVNKDQTFNNGFTVCSALEEIRFTGEIGKSISFQHSSKLSIESAKDTMIHLVNYFGTDEEFAYTVQFPTKVWENLDAEGETSPTGTTWKKYIEDKGWLK